MPGYDSRISVDGSKEKTKALGTSSPARHSEGGSISAQGKATDEKVEASRHAKQHEQEDHQVGRDLPLLYFASVDIKKCFDTVDQVRIRHAFLVMGCWGVPSFVNSP